MSCALPCLVALFSPSLPQEELPVTRFAGEALVVQSWLTLPAVDARGRRPFRPDAVLARYLIDEESAPPRAGESVKGETGEASWSARTVGEDGRVGEAAWAYARVESAAVCVVLAHLDRAATLFVNGVPRGGDPYGFGFGVPVELAAGANELYVSGVRGAFRLSLSPCAEGLLVGDWDLTLPTLTVGAVERAHLGLLVWNASPVAVPALAVEVVDGGGVFRAQTCVVRGGWVPFGQRKLALTLLPLAGASLAEPGEVKLRLRVSGHPDGRSVEQPITLSVRAPGELAVRTRISGIDGSVQKYAVLPPTGAPRDGPMRLLLSLHGAGVDCEGQAACYSAKPDFWIVAPTNRRPYGFDWQDWGRTDAYETLAAARLLPGAARAPVVLTGHSMGGHGTWHLAANDPSTFAAIAPSAGWRSFDSYGGRPEGARRELWHAADAASRTEDLLANLVQLPTFVLHGEADDNVPASEGHAMVEALLAAGGEPRSHFEPGAGHWWGACVDWPGIFELFRSVAPAPTPRTLDWHGVDLSVDSRHHWVEVEQLREYGRPFHVSASESEGRVRMTSTNVRRLALRTPEPWQVCALELDGQELRVDGPSTFELEGGTWTAVTPTHPMSFPEKLPWGNGPLKRAFANDFVLVVPTLGSERENAAALARARHDAEVWEYRGNGEAEIVADEDFSRGSGNVVLYGNASTNAAWERVVPADYPLRIERGRVRLGERTWEGNALGALAVGSSGGGLFAVLGSSGTAADRAAASLSLFISGVGYPDYAVCGPEVLAQGDGGVYAAGFFDHRWKLSEEPPESAPASPPEGAR
jgi:prolyl oligopeptidase family protein